MTLNQINIEQIELLNKWIDLLPKIIKIDDALNLVEIFQNVETYIAQNSIEPFYSEIIYEAIVRKYIGSIKTPFQLNIENFIEKLQSIPIPNSNIIKESDQLEKILDNYPKVKFRFSDQINEKQHWLNNNEHLF